MKLALAKVYMQSVSTCKATDMTEQHIVVFKGHSFKARIYKNDVA
jgi:hypothetical protein